MNWKSVLTVLTDKTLGDLTLGPAAALARESGAHLDVLCLGVDHSQQGYFFTGGDLPLMQVGFDQATQEADSLADYARGWLRGHDLRWSVEEGAVQLAQAARQVAGLARFADLVVLPRPYGHADVGTELEQVIEGALFDGAAPVLVMPDAKPPVLAPRSVLLAWNGAPEALRAAQAALPILRNAETVHVVLIDPPRHSATRSDPGGLLAQYLARHGCSVEIEVLSRTMHRVSDVLCRHAVDIGSEMIVMGAYGHSRFREAILGGATRNMLEQAGVPVLMAH